jgi:hypothetical protein
VLHALLTGSLAIDAGAPRYDQRGSGYRPEVNGRIGFVLFLFGFCHWAVLYTSFFTADHAQSEKYALKRLGVNFGLDRRSIHV